MESKAQLAQLQAKNTTFFEYVRDHISYMVKVNGVGGTLQIVFEALTQKSISLNQCHILLHLLGHESYEYYQHDLGKIIQNGSKLCGDSYFHGVESQIAYYSNNATQELSSLCIELKKQNSKRRCYEGAGHVFMAISPHNVIKALDHCNALISFQKEDFESCYAGVFSEYGHRVNNTDSDTGKHYPGPALEHLDYPHPLLFCKTFEYGYRTSCNLSLVKLIDAKAKNRDEALANCLFEGYDEEARKTCVWAIARYIVEDTLMSGKTATAPTIVLSFLQTYRESYILGAKSIFTQFSNTGVKNDPHSLCKSFKNDVAICESLFKP